VGFVLLNLKLLWGFSGVCVAQSYVVVGFSGVCVAQSYVVVWF
jgi:hypothetical protein